MTYISQPQLCSAILKELDRQGVSNLLPRQMNVILRAANNIISEMDKPELKVTDGMGIEAWLESDQTGTSSEFMAGELSGRFHRRYGHPHDPSDLGRCIGLLKACPELREKIPEMSKYTRQWAALVENWDELESLYNEEFSTGKAPRLYKRMTELIGGAT